MSISKNKNFKPILERISSSLGIDISENPNLVNNELSRRNKSNQIPDLRLNSELMLFIEWNIVEILRDLGIDNYGAMQFPANVRVLNNQPRANETGNYKTTHLHCDSWSGAPQDTLNLFLGLYVSEGAPWLKMYKTFPTNHPAFSYTGPYTEAPVQEQDLEEVLVPRKSGTLVMWPTQTPHKTHISHQSSQASEVWRISIDIRIRLNNPYALETDLTDEKFSLSKMNSLGVYWFKPANPFISLKEKIKYEEDQLRVFNLSAKEARKLYLEKFYG